MTTRGSIELSSQFLIRIILGVVFLGFVFALARRIALWELLIPGLGTLQIPPLVTGLLITGITLVVLWEMASA